MKDNPYSKYVSTPAQGENPYAKYASPTQESPQPVSDMGRLEAIARGALYGGLQQPRDVVVAAAGDAPFEQGLAEATKASLEGEQGVAEQTHPNYFTGGQIAGNIITSLLPAGVVTKAIGAAAPIIRNAPVVGKALSNLARGIGSSKGLVGVPAAGGIQGGVSTLMTEGDLSGAGPGAVGAGVMSATSKVVRPLAEGAISKARQGYVDVLKKVGIDDLTPGQLTGGKGLETIDSVLGGMLPTAGAARKKSEGQLRKFTQAALAKAGINADEITPEVRELAEANFGKRYSDLMANQTVKIDEPVFNTMADIVSKQMDKLDVNTKPIVSSYLRDLAQSGGVLTGEAYQAARSDLTQRAKSMTDTYTAGVLRKIRNTLDAAAERSLPSSKKGAWKQLNREYGNYKTVQKAASRISADSLEGVLSPAALANVVETANKTKGQKGYGELYDLSRAGRAVLSDSVPNSGSAQRLFVQQLLTQSGVGLGAAGATGAITQDPELTMMALGGSLAAPKAIQLLMNNPAAQAYFTKGIPLANKLATPQARTLAAILSGQGATE